ncbi:expressed unknown protein [Seminavis robusta]|uniref:Uncharacterized protein n=1 Tax=Seminavis robusta TaxID=568900 RepID=A0A9N8H4D5_9STRA|nr:expressed unknown protein [Seminavis robusta]|eukprot:Sro82_g043910.1 n/a (99) ;mRNA; r:77139-77566
MRSTLMLLSLLLVSAAAGRRGAPTGKPKTGKWGTPSPVPFLDMSLPLEEDLAKDIDDLTATKKVKAVKKRPAKFVSSPVPGPMPAPALFGFPPIIGLE